MGRSVKRRSAAEGRYIERFGEELFVRKGTEENVKAGIMTKYSGQCDKCICRAVTDEQKQTDPDLELWCIVKCWECREVYKHPLIHGVVHTVEVQYEERIRELENEKEEMQKHIEELEKLLNGEPFSQRELKDKREEKKSVKGTYIRRKPALERCWSWFERERKEDRHYSNKYIGSRTETEEHRVSEARKRYIAIVKDVAEGMGIEEMSKKWHVGINLAKRMSKAIQKTTKKMKEKNVG